MEIPYIVTPRKDTGLFNSKIAIWLFLASEVMLFGGFFSAYVYLRLGAEHDYPWPERSLPVIPGLINTFVLIFSSVTVVFAWASLKLRQWRRFQVFMSITIACSGMFMVLKGIEYYVKFHHQALRLMDYTVVEGHLAKVTEKPAGEAHEEHGSEEHGGHAEGPLVHDRNGKEIEANVINFETTEITFNTVRAEKPWVAEMIADATEQKAKITLSKPIVLGIRSEDWSDEKGVHYDGANTLVAKLEKGESPEVSKDATVFKKGTELTQKLIDDIDKLHLKARGHNAAVRTENLRKQWTIANDANKGIPERDYQDKVAVDEKAIAGELLAEQAAITFKVDPAVTFRFRPHDIKETATDGTLRDGTMLKGKLLASPMEFHYIDALDFRHTVMKAKEKGIDPEIAIKNSWILKNNPQIAAVWEKHEKAIEQLKEEFKKEGRDREPTLKDLYRINWEEMAYYGDTKLEDVKINPKDFAAPTIAKNAKEQFMGPDYATRHFPHLEVPREQVQFTSKFSPAWNTFYAIYFTMTGLHGLHVIGGALVLGYYLFFGKKMYQTNPEWLANRVEIGGLFWHFVDLVWIFLFPILYLM